MLLTLLANLSLALSAEWFTDILRQSFYPALLSIFIIASLGVPIPEDIPLIAAGVILKTHPEIASWPLTVMVSLMGIMSGDIILYSLGRRWGREVFSHRSVAWLITPRRVTLMSEKFHTYGVWMCFFGRFMVGVRAVMCLTAGVTRFPFWKFLIADFCGAMLSAPLFIFLGYFFANMLDQVKHYMVNAQYFLLAATLFVGLIIWRKETRKLRRLREEDIALQAKEDADKAVGTVLVQPSPPATPNSTAKKPKALKGRANAKPDVV